MALKTETNTPKIEAAVLRAVKAQLVNRARRLNEFRAFFEHGQFWVEHLPSGAQWSVCDCEPGDFCFEQVTEGEES
jgi:hypothetical protein